MGVVIEICIKYSGGRTRITGTDFIHPPVPVPVSRVGLGLEPTTTAAAASAAPSGPWRGPQTQGPTGATAPKGHRENGWRRRQRPLQEAGGGEGSGRCINWVAAKVAVIAQSRRR
jgi:hypothetical protein